MTDHDTRKPPHRARPAIRRLGASALADPAWLREAVEGARRRHRAAGPRPDSLFDPPLYRRLLDDLEKICDQQGQCRDSRSWDILCGELKAAAALLLDAEPAGEEPFHFYATVYDDLVCRPWLDGFMKAYLRFFHQRCEVDWARASLLSIGCGTGLVEEHILEAYDLSADSLLGIDISESMVREARRRIPAELGDVLTLDPELGTWDLAFTGLNVLQHLDAAGFDEAMRRVAAVVKPGGYFLGDFIAPDHIRWYPYVMYSKDRKSTSLRSPRLIERDQQMLQHSDIVNVTVKDGRLHITPSVHERYLPPMSRVRQAFEELYAGPVEVFDAVTLEPLGERADTCASTRYVVFARKG